MSSIDESPDQPANRLRQLLIDFAICVLLLAVVAVILSPHLPKRVSTAESHLETVTMTAGSLQSAATIERAERLMRGSTVKRDFDAPKTGALKVVPRPIAADNCAQMWNKLMPAGPVASTGAEAKFTVEPTDERGICLYRYNETNKASYIISYRPESGQVAYN